MSIFVKKNVFLFLLINKQFFNNNLVSIFFVSLLKNNSTHLSTFHSVTWMRHDVIHTVRITRDSVVTDQDISCCKVRRTNVIPHTHVWRTYAYAQMNKHINVIKPLSPFKVMTVKYLKSWKFSIYLRLYGTVSDLGM